MKKMPHNPKRPSVPSAVTPASAPLVLGVECGGTKSVALLATVTGELVARAEFGSGNFRLLSPAQLRAHFRAMAKSCPGASAVGLGLAGVRTEEDRAAVRAAAAEVWPSVPCWVGNDLETAIESPEIPMGKAAARVTIISGTGSCCYGHSATGKVARVGGWGHLLGDRASGYDIGHQALRGIISHHDLHHEWPRLGARILRALQLTEPEQLIGWVQGAGKAEVSALTIEVFAAALEGDPVAKAVLDTAARTLAGDAAQCAAHLAPKGSLIQFFFVGSVLNQHPEFAQRVTRLLRARRPKAEVGPIPREGAWGAVLKAAQLTGQPGLCPPGRAEYPGLDLAAISSRAAEAAFVPGLRPLSPTEERNPRSMKLDRLTVGDAIDLMLSEDARIPAAILREKAKLERAVRWISGAFAQGGRLFYAGAGTSGRLGVLDASECPPTFRTPPEMVQGLMAGGANALWNSVEGAEDDLEAGRAAIAHRHVGKKDVLVGIAASGRTPFVWGALHEARQRGAKTILLCFNPRLEVPRRERPDLIIAPDTGPEVLTGSTRLKAGTATKLILNLLTTLSMVRQGKVVSNLMVDLNPSNVKLRDRAVRIVGELTGADADQARTALERVQWNVKAATRHLGADRRKSG